MAHIYMLFGAIFPVHELLDLIMICIALICFVCGRFDNVTHSFNRFLCGGVLNVQTNVAKNPAVAFELMVHGTARGFNMR